MILHVGINPTKLNGTKICPFNQKAEVSTPDKTLFNMYTQ